MRELPAALQGLDQYSRFVTWFAVPDADRPGKFKKLPCDYRTGHVSDVHNSNIWTTSTLAMGAAPAWDKGYGSGAGFVFTSDDPFFFLDIDNCLQDDGTWSPIAIDLCSRFHGAAVEVSLSGRGLHIFGRTTPTLHGTRNSEYGLELYTSGRFVALTGVGAIGDINSDHTAAFQQVAATLFPANVTSGPSGNWTTEPDSEWSGPEDDDILIGRMLKSASKSPSAKFGGGNMSLPDLWEGHVDDNLRSEADQSLANHLAFWTGKNCERIERLMRRSGLTRDKWDSPSHRNYLTNTILKACSFVSAVYQQKTQKPAAPITATTTATTAPRKRGPGHEYMLPDAQEDYFKNCYYIASSNEIFDIGRNALYPKTSFDVVYGGHVFFMDVARDKKTDSAFDAYCKSLTNTPRIVDDLCFRPELPLGAIIVDGVRSYLNSYVPYECPMTPGDPTPFLDLLSRMLPNENDRTLFLHYIASLTQNPGVKFQWWPVLQGVEGNGKTFIIKAISYIMGEHYTHLPNAHAMARDGLKFNAWIERKLFIGIEEVRLSGKREFLDEFKIIVTNERIPSERKGVDQVNTDNRANGILCTNHPDGVPIDKNSRRYAVFFTNQQVVEDLHRDGMDGDYFPNLFNWFRNGGNAIIAHYLKNYKLSADLDPAQNCKRAPLSSSYGEAIAVSRGRIEQELLEAIDEGRPGFIKPWVSSKAIDRLVADCHGYLPPSKRRDVMRTLGYDYHPVLNNGRTNNVVSPDNTKPRLFCLRKDDAWNLPTPAAVEHAYTSAQEAPALARLTQVK